MALGAVGFRIIEAALFVMAAVSMLALVPVSREFTHAIPSTNSPINAMGTALVVIRDTASFALGPMAFGLGALLYSIIFLRHKLLPRWLPVWGIIAIILHVAGASLVLFHIIRPWFTVHTILNIPFLQEVVPAVWLIARGFDTTKPAPVSAKP